MKRNNIEEISYFMMSWVMKIWDILRIIIIIIIIMKKKKERIFICLLFFPVVL